MTETIGIFPNLSKPIRYLSSAQFMMHATNEFCRRKHTGSGRYYCLPNKQRKWNKRGYGAKSTKTIREDPVSAYTLYLLNNQ